MLNLLLFGKIYNSLDSDFSSEVAKESLTIVSNSFEHDTGGKAFLDTARSRSFYSRKTHKGNIKDFKSIIYYKGPKQIVYWVNHCNIHIGNLLPDTDKLWLLNFLQKLND